MFDGHEEVSENCLTEPQEREPETRAESCRRTGHCLRPGSSLILPGDLGANETGVSIPANVREEVKKSFC
jgi:hypothetical protein